MVTATVIAAISSTGCAKAQTAPAAAAGVTPPPRLAGILIWPGERRAIFDVDGESVVLGPGERLAGYTIEQITAQAVTLVTARDRWILRPNHGATPPPPSSLLPPGADPARTTFGLVLNPEATPPD
ncbi:conserved protein of unknown function [Rhodovastum atsumiense]|uniref:Uncharacterized protein n=1 Tax=Rhodovastum atsumiense TaxID=504468 RepID=A0A5M6INC1_9PROT|nr:hypothetical protein [Rhodovastum atsumiense]KAA5609389.1 hypothetical protein F1189_24230 [Rhodovastum atsumiense]CAH2601857.1 conserved protein of unknown function [Rhodovastum atsumiense]